MESDAITANDDVFLERVAHRTFRRSSFECMIQGHHEIATLESQCVRFPKAWRSLTRSRAKFKAFTVMQKELACMGISMALKTVAEDDEDIVYE
jgi:hypothetical protein